MPLDRSAFTFLFVHAQLLAEGGLQAALAELAAGAGAAALQPREPRSAQDPGVIMGPTLTAFASDALAHQDLASFDWGALDGTSLGAPADRSCRPDPLAWPHAQDGATEREDQQGPVLAAAAAGSAEAEAMAGEAAAAAPGDRDSAPSPLRLAYGAIPDLAARIADCQSQIPDGELAALLDAIGPSSAALAAPLDDRGLEAWMARYLVRDPALGTLVARIRAADTLP